MTVRRLLYGTAVGFVTLGASLRATAPVPDLRRARELHRARGSPVPEPAARRVPRPAPPPTDSARYAPIVAGDVFSPTRTPPTVRFTPDQTADAPAPRPRPPADKGADPAFHLLGVSVSTHGALALIAAGGAPGHAALYRPGDRVAGGSIASITATTVVVERPEGPLVLRLPPAGGRRP